MKGYVKGCGSGVFGFPFVTLHCVLKGYVSKVCEMEYKWGIQLSFCQLVLKECVKGCIGEVLILLMGVCSTKNVLL